MIAAFFDWLLDFLYGVASLFLGWLPDSPFKTEAFDTVLDRFSTLMAYINYFVPVGDLIIITSLYVSAVLIWYGVRWVLRMIRYIE